MPVFVDPNGKLLKSDMLDLGVGKDLLLFGGERRFAEKSEGPQAPAFEIVDKLGDRCVLCCMDVHIRADGADLVFVFVEDQQAEALGAFCRIGALGAGVGIVEIDGDAKHRDDGFLVKMQKDAFGNFAGRVAGKMWSRCHVIGSFAVF